ncbi:CHAT domain-containing protein [Almyronema epifaneia]|uniref:CHAT domain-containing protein n=1 Tax=Almyronema epifaneia S1 TaxID=2991925 RepID=A0ABW6IDQ3_9CYAN
MFLFPQRLTHWVGLCAFTTLAPTAVLAQSVTPALDGTGTQVDQSGDRYTITGGSASGANLFHSFREFNLSAPEAANFVTAPTVANILGRISGGQASVINGLLQITGSQANLYLINPAGVLFGPNARLDLPSALVVTTADGIGFINGGWFSAFGANEYGALVGDPTQFAFTTATPGAIVNAGNLGVNAGEAVMLLGGSVINTGTISAPGGEVTIAAIPGENIVRISHAGLLLNLEVETLANHAAIAAVLPNPQSVTPSSLPALLTGSGLGNATGIRLNADGTVTLSGSAVAAPVAGGTALVGGSVDVAAPVVGVGGSVNLLGQTVGVLAAQVDAAGAAGGGDIRIGGGYQGQENIPNAAVTVVGDRTTIQANALSNGDGGRIIVWSDLATRIYGHLAAVGGALGGDGGLIETSSLGVLDIPFAPDLSAALGTGGTWLIDPPEIEIAVGGNQNINPPPTTVFTPTPAGSAAVLNIDTLRSALTGGTSITVRTSAAFTPLEDADIILTADLDLSGLDGALRLEAADDVVFAANVINPGAGNVAFTIAATDQALIDSGFTVNTGGGNFTVDNSNFIVASGATLNTQGGTIEHTGGGFTQIDGTLDAGLNGRILLTGINGSGAGITVNGSLLSQNGEIILNGTGIPGLDLSGLATLDAGSGTIALNGNSTVGSGIFIREPAVEPGVFQASQINFVGTSSSGNGIEFEADFNSGGSNLSLTGNSGSGLGIFAQNVISEGGNLTLASSNADIEVSTLEATGGTAAAILVSTIPDRFFRATGSFEFGGGSASVASNGGPITIRHGGEGEVPFIVGDASQNGSAAAIANNPSAFNFSPVEEILFTTARNGVSIESVAAPPPPPPAPNPSPRPTPSNLDFDNVACLPDCQTADLEVGQSLDSTPILTTDEDSPSGVAQRIVDIETAFTQEFVQHLGITEDVPIQSVNQGQQKLQEIVQAAGTTPAIIYVAFTPAPGNLSQVTSPVGRAVPGQPETENAVLFSSSAAATALKAENTTAQQNALKQANDQLELILVTPGQDPVRVRLPEVTRSQMLQVASQLRREVTDRTRRRTTSYLPPAQQLYQWIIAPLAAELAAQNVQHISFVLDAGLRSLPIAALHSGQGFIIEQYSVALMPSLSLTDTRYQDVRGAEVLAMGTADFADLPDLPAVAIELANIVGRLWPGEALTNEQFTADSLVAQRRDRPYSLLHLATHGEFNEGSLDNSFIQFWDRRVQLSEIRQLQLNNPLAELLVLSACRTALGNPEAELGFAGLAVQTGAKTALASLWLVDDVGAASFMMEFYDALRTTPIRATALQQAQLAMMRGETQVTSGRLAWSGGELPLPETVAQNLGTLSHPYFWAAFTLVGSPW